MSKKQIIEDNIIVAKQDVPFLWKDIINTYKRNNVTPQEDDRIEVYDTYEDEELSTYNYFKVFRKRVETEFEYRVRIKKEKQHSETVEYHERMKLQGLLIKYGDSLTEDNKKFIKP